MEEESVAEITAYLCMKRDTIYKWIFMNVNAGSLDRSALEVQ